MRLEKLKGSIINGLAILSLSTLIVKILGLLFKIPLSYILSDEGMGYFNTAYTVYTFFYIICTAGVPKAISVLISEKSGQGKEEEGDKLFISAFWIFSFIGLLCTVIFSLTAGQFSHIIGSERSHLTMIAVAPSLLFVSASGALRGYFNGKVKFLPIAVSEIISGVAKLALGLLFANYAHKMGYPVYVTAAFSILGITVGAFLGFLYLFIVNKKEKIGKKTKSLNIKSSFSDFGKIMKIAIPITLTSAIGSLLNLIDVAFVMRGLAEIGFTELQANILYGNYTTMVVPMFNLISMLLTPVSMVLLPALTKYKTSGDFSAFSAKCNEAYKIVSVFAVPIMFVFMFFSKEILQIIFEPSGAAMAAPLLALISPAVLLMSVLFLMNTAIEGAGNFKLPLISLTAGSLIKIILGYILIRNDSFNMMASPLGTVASYAVGILISGLYLALNGKIKIHYFSPILFASTASVLGSIIVQKLEFLFFNFKNETLKTFAMLTIFAILYFLFLSIFYIFPKTIKNHIHIRQKNTN